MHNYGPDCCIQSTSYFSEIEAFGLDSDADELEEYLAAPPSLHVPDPFVYWSGWHEGGSALAGMVFDYMSVPG